MIARSDILTSSAERPLRLRVRADLIARRQTYQGRNYWMVKDPLALKFYRFEQEEYAILQMVDGRTSLADIQRQFERRFAPQRLALPELQSLLSRLFQQSLVVSEAAGQGRELHERHLRSQHQQRLQTWTNVLCVRFPGINPDRFLHWLNGRLGWIFAWPSVMAALMLIGAALILVGVEFDTFLERLPGFQEFFAARNWLLLALVLSGTKVLHELGHGLACKRFGGQCQEMGLMFLVLTPCLYCNVSDSWMLRSKWRRAAIGAAGMYVELVLAALCTFLWWFSEVGLIHYLCLNVMVVCSINTLLFNGNPLLRYDGYFILADLLEIPNLRQKSTTVCQRKAAQWLLGLPVAEDPFLPRRRRWLFALYALAASLYRWLIVLSILWFLYRVFEPYGLKLLGQMLVVAALYGLIVAPLWRLVTFLRHPGRMRQVKKLRFLLSTSLLTAAVAGLLLVPLPHYVQCDFRLQPRDATPVYVDVPGTLEVIAVRAGQTVRRGQLLAVLGNLDVRLNLERLQGEREQLAAKLEGLQLRAYRDEAALREMSQVREALAALDQRIAGRREDLKRLSIQAPAGGVVFSTPHPASADDARQLPSWSGDPLRETNQGAYLTEGTPLCKIGSRSHMEAILAVDENIVKFIRAGQEVDLQLAQLRPWRLAGKIVEISRADMHVTPAAYRSAVDNQARTRGHETRERRLPGTTYQARLPVDIENGLIVAGATGRAKVHAGYRTLGQHLMDALRRTFRLEL